MFTNQRPCAGAVAACVNKRRRIMGILKNKGLGVRRDTRGLCVALQTCGFGEGLTIRGVTDVGCLDSRRRNPALSLM